MFEAESQLQVYVNITTSWLTDNGLIVNPSKSNSMIIITKQRTNKPNSLLKIKIKNSIIDQTNSFKLLGVEIDNNLTWYNHASQIAKRLLSKIGLIKRLQQTLPSYVIHKLYAPYFCHKLIIVSLCGETVLLKLLIAFKGYKIELQGSLPKILIEIFLAKIFS